MPPTPRKEQKFKVVFFGTSEFAVPILEALTKMPGIEIACVVTKPDRSAGRDHAPAIPPVKTLAEKIGISVVTNFHDRENLLHQPDIAVVAAYGRIIPAETVNFPKFGTINVHPSLLPKYRGPSPIQSAIANGEQETGVTIMKLDAQMDHGPLLAQRVVKIEPNDTTLSLSKKLAEVGAQLLVKTLPDYLASRTKPVDQDHTKATVCKLIDRDDGKIDWSKSLEEIERMFRAFHPWPGIWTIWKGKRLKILKIKMPFEILEVQLEGKKPMSIAEFSRGHADFSFARLREQISKK